GQIDMRVGHAERLGGVSFDDLLSLFSLMQIEKSFAINVPDVNAMGEVLRGLRVKELVGAQGDLVAVEQWVRRGFLEQDLERSKAMPQALGVPTRCTQTSSM